MILLKVVDNDTYESLCFIIVSSCLYLKLQSGQSVIYSILHNDQQDNLLQ